MIKLNTIELEISNPCNEKCVHCYRTCSSTKKGFLSLDDVKNIFSQCKNILAEKTSVTITGGEATLNPQWKEILAFVISKGCRTSLFTNGTLLKEDDVAFLAKYSQEQLKEVQISLYALDSQVHDAVTQLKGSFEKTMNAVNLLRKNNVPIFISCPAMQINKNYFPDVMRWADSEGIASCVDIFIFGTSDYTESNLCQRLSDEDLEVFFKTSLEDNGALSYVWGSEEKILLETIPFYGGAVQSLCFSGDGSIFPMIGWYAYLGNIKDNNIEALYLNHPLLQKIRNIYASDFPECKKCDVSNYCNFCPSPHLCANNGELFKLDKEFCNYIHKKKNFIQRRDKVLSLKQ
ncbi:radical SAM protein [Treponema phagedenis]|uniref:radical SAM protein n=1 Tax=Treponema phagedenis TaxID=162 RepID=UPI001981556E|nr:radical SAM protein [Treponema phagedenis]QSH95230.1 hypothetical protein C5O78_09360 [Treponema phagedenis]